MPGKDTLESAVDELYSIEPDGFTKRRDTLAAQARRDGDAVAAKAIAALRRPTKAAWVLNRLAREDPDTAYGLAELGKDLHKAQRSLDGARLRELTQQRRKLIDAASRKAFQLSGERDPSAALRNEVASTLEAALAHADTAEHFTAGTLVRSAEWSGFGDAVPTLTAVPSPPAKRSATKKAAFQAPDKPAERKSAEREREREHEEQRRQQRLSDAQDALEQATAELEAADDAEGAQQEKVDLLTEQLADARRRLDEARLNARHAKGRQRDAQRRVERLQG
jgi:predicted ribosome quality control (RQC) complex YloA/Tae2 family protein